MNKQEKVQFVIKKLEELYPQTPIPLHHSNPFTLLVAVLMSAQTTDVGVNKVTPKLFSLASTPKEMSKLTAKRIESVIKTVGLAPTKAKNIQRLSKIILDEHQGIVPNTFEELEKLPGVGHKTASVVMSQAFGQPAFPVDTHIHRLLYRWTFSSGKNVVQSEKDAKRLFPKNLWNKLHLQIIFFGREYCPARSHNPNKCPICSLVGRKSMFK